MLQKDHFAAGLFVDYQPGLHRCPRASSWISGRRR